MNFKKAFELLGKDSIFTEWSASHPSAFTAYFFSDIDEQLQLGPWQIGLYDKKEDKIAKFIVDTQITYEPLAEAFKKPGGIKKLDIKKAKISAEEARDTFLLLQKKKYVQHLVLKGFLILQNIEQGTVWNVTLLTRTFAALNVKVNATNGEIVEDQLMTFFDMSEISPSTNKISRSTT